MEYGLVALWLTVYLVLLVAGAPLAAVLCRRLPDRGVGLGLPLAAAVLWVAGYWVGLGSLAAAPWAGLGLLLGLAALVTYTRRPTLDTGVVVETAAVFTVAFLFLVAVRAVDPAVHSLGGEKFLDFGLLRSLLRAETLPAEDMWFAGEPVSYYYGGHLLASLLTRLTGTAPRFAYNLALAGFYAMLVTAAYGLAGSVAAVRGTPRRLGGTLGAFFVGFASNLVTPLTAAFSVLPDGVATTLADGVGYEPAGTAVAPARFSYWDASRVIEGTINEFPLFAWLNGDLHAHMMSTPFLLLVAGTCFAYVLTPEAAVWRRRLLVVGVLPPLAGLLAVVNTWSFPTVGGLTALALLFAPADPRTLLPTGLGTRLRATTRAGTEATRLGTALGAGALVVLVGVLWSAPFWFGTATPRSVGLLPERSGLGPLVLVHGLFLLVFALYLTRHALGTLSDPVQAGAAVLVVGAVGLLADAPAVSLFGPLLGVGWLLLRVADGQPSRVGRGGGAVASADGGGGTAEAVTAGDGDDRPGFETILVVAGAGLALLVEFVFLEEQAGPGRLNTVFKTYMQVWVLWGVAGGVVLAHLCWQHRPTLGLSRGTWRPVFRVLAVVLVLATAVYGGFALANHFEAGGPYSRVEEPTLNATAFVVERHPEEAGAIRWLDDRTGRPTIVTAPGSYQWAPQEGEGASAPASLTGVPTVLGWHHEIGYRGLEAYQRRQGHVETIYTGSPADQRRLLEQYDVEYVYVGPAERSTYARVTIQELDSVTVARSWPSVTIYQVNGTAVSDRQ